MGAERDGDGQAQGLRRRDLLRRAGLLGAAAAVPVGIAAAPAAAVEEQREQLAALTATEARALNAMVARLVPTDANGPGATEARVGRYIDRALAGDFKGLRPPTRPGSRRWTSTRRASTARCSTRSTRRAGRRRRGPRGQQGDRLHAERRDVLRDRPHAHAAGHVQRPGARREREVRRLGSARLPGVKMAVHCHGAADGRPDQGRPPVGRRLRHLQGISNASRRRRTHGHQAQEDRRRHRRDGAAGGTAALPLARRARRSSAWRPARALHAGRLHRRRGPPRRPQLARPREGHWEVPTVRATPAMSRQRASGIVMMNGVGGSAIHYTGQSWRLSPYTFKERGETIRRYGAGAIPAGVALVDWPVSYAELEPYYDRVETRSASPARRGRSAARRTEGQRVRGARRREYPNPPLRTSRARRR